jgi:alkyl hydroperoxide reductase subunit AhpC
MLEVGERIPEATVWTLEREPVSVPSLVEARPILLVFYLFDFSST